MAPTKQKALVLESKQGPFKVADIDVPKPGPNRILVKTISAALNPVDWKIQTYGIVIETYPFVLGLEAAGIVEELGEGVTNFKVGDKVLAETSFITDPDSSAFQQYFLANADVSARIPDNISFDEAASIPVCLSTAALGLYHDGRPEQSAGLIPPWEERGEGKYAGTPLVVFGGATSTGQYVIQLGKLSGFSPIIITASPHNADLLKSLGATHVLDRSLSAATLAAEVQKITSAPISLVYDAVSLPDTQNAAYDLLAPGGTLVILVDAVITAKNTAEKRVVHVYGDVNAPYNRQVGQSLFSKLPHLLQTGMIKPNRVEVLKDGLAGIPDGVKRLGANKVSGVKLIARPQETP